MPGAGIKGLGLGKAAAGEMPSTPVISIAAGVGQVTVTISGSDATSTNYVLYKGSSDTAWQVGGSRVGDGDVVVTGLENNNPYIFITYSEEGVSGEGIVSLPSAAIPVTLGAAAENDFDDLLVENAPVFLVTFGVGVSYLPRGGGSRAILAIVDYGVPEGVGSMPHGMSPMITIDVANKATAVSGSDLTGGISSSELDTGGDKVLMPARMSRTAQQRPLAGLLSQDEGMIKLEVR